MGTTCTIDRGEALASSEMALQMYTDLAIGSRKFVIGLTGIKPPIGYNRGNVAVDQAGSLGFDIPTLARFQPITAKMDYLYNDEEHAELSNRGLCAQDYFQDVWIYARRDKVNPANSIIWIPNHVQYPNGGFSVQNFNLGEQSAVNGKWMVDVTLLSNIQCITAFIHLEDSAVPTYTFTTGANDTIARSAGDFAADGLKAGMKVFIDDEAATLSNYRKIVTVQTVAALTLTLEDSGVLVADAVGAATTVLRSGWQL